MDRYAKLAPWFDEICEKLVDYDGAVSELRGIGLGKHVLEIGSGTGNLAYRLARDHWVTAQEGSVGLHGKAKFKQFDTPCQITPVCLELPQVHSRKNGYDSIVMFDSVFCAMRYPDGVMIESYLRNSREITAAMKSMSLEVKSGCSILMNEREPRGEGKVRLSGSDKASGGSGLFYWARTRRISEDEMRIRHTLFHRGNPDSPLADIRKPRIIAKSDIVKRLVPLDDFVEMFSDAGQTHHMTYAGNNWHSFWR